MELSRLGSDSAIRFAFSELSRYLRLIQKNLFIKECVADSYTENTAKLWVGICPAFDTFLPSVENKALDDAIYIHVIDGTGIITGTNPRAVLIAVYRFLKELGVCWIRPGPDGEILPEALPATYTIQVCEAASYRHRTICIEGAVSCDHVRNMIDWIPKASMNGYYIQFRTPYTFFERWYRHTNNPLLPKEPFSYEDVLGIQKILEEDIEQRGLMYQSIGHGWTCEPLGIKGLGWDKDETVYPEEISSKFALVNGKRELWDGVALNTSLCYSNPEVRVLMSDAVVEYCTAHPNVDYVHVWLADCDNNHCECESCQEKRPADFYIMILNEIDRKLTEAGIPTKIFFLLYLDLLWPNVEEKLLNQDRFVLMFAPITRTYTKTYTDYDKDEQVTLPPYIRNHLKLPTRVEENIAFLKAWQANFSGDSADFDYHLMWDHLKDPGYYRCAEILFADAENLDQIGLGGYISCQLQRAAFPTGLPMEMMATALWNKKAVFEQEADRYFKSAFGKDHEKVRDYLQTLSREFVPPYARGELGLINPDVVRSVTQAKETICGFRDAIEENIAATKGNIRQSWIYLRHHGKLNLLYADVLIALASGDDTLACLCIEKLFNFARRLELDVHNVFDVFEYMDTLKQILKTLGKSIL